MYFPWKCSLEFKVLLKALKKYNLLIRVGMPCCLLTSVSQSDCPSVVLGSNLESKFSSVRCLLDVSLHFLLGCSRNNQSKMLLFQPADVAAFSSNSPVLRSTFVPMATWAMRRWTESVSSSINECRTKRERSCTSWRPVLRPSRGTVSFFDYPLILWIIH